MARQTDAEATSRLGRAAVRYAEHGWPVLPLHSPRGGGCSCRTAECGSPGKHPRTRQGLHEATTDLEQVRSWWTRWPDANIGVVTGSRSGLLVLDVDLPHGSASLTELQDDYLSLSPTCEQRTGSGGRQLLWRMPDRDVGNRSGVRPGIDVRGEGGYVVVPPSLHATGSRYAWTSRRDPAPAPDWLVALVERRVEPVRTSPPPRIEIGRASGADPYAAGALRSELARLSAAVPGTRNASLNRAAFSLGQLVGAGVLDEDLVVGELERVAQHVGLGLTETRRTIASGLGAGLEQPREILRRELGRTPSGDTGLAPLVRRIGGRRR